MACSRWALRLLTLFLVGFGLTFGCIHGDDDDGGGVPAGPIGQGTISGQVASPKPLPPSPLIKSFTNAFPIPDVDVSIDGEVVATTGPDGRFSADIDEGTHIVTFSKDGFLPNVKKIEVEAGQVRSAPISLLEQAGISDFDFDNLSVTIPFDDGDGPHHVTVEPGSLARESTPDEPYVGVVLARVTYVNPNTNDIFGFPGSFAGAIDGDGNEQTIETFGFAHYHFETEDGEKLVVIDGLEESMLPLIEFDLPLGTDAEDEHGMGLWGFDEDEGIWQEETGFSITIGDGMFSARVPHFSR